MLSLFTLLLASNSLAASISPRGSFFGTITLGDQEAEHERVTRAALECPADTPSDDSCFEPQSILSLAGGSGTGGAVGAPDLGTGALEAKAHCDDADYLDHAKYGIPGQYGQSRETANKALTDCIGYLRGFFQAGVKAAGGILDENGQIKMDESDLSSTCTYTGGFSGRAKCETYDGFGRALHGLEDFYSHSNWIDSPDPNQDISASNPPGLNMSELAPFLAMRNESVNTSAIPNDFSTGCFVLNWQDGTKGADKCIEQNRNVTHVVLNKDNGDIQQTANASIPANPPLTMNSRTSRGQIGNNYERAVEFAVLEARRQWSDFRSALVAEYGEERGKTIICALTRDKPWRSCGLLTLSGTGGGDRLETNKTYIINVNATANGSDSNTNRVFKFTAEEKESLNFTLSRVNETAPLQLSMDVWDATANALKYSGIIEGNSSRQSLTAPYTAEKDANIEVRVNASGISGNQTEQYSIRVDSSTDGAKSAAVRLGLPVAMLLLPALAVLL